MATVLFPLPDHDFDVTEVAVPWRLLRDAGHEPVFATETGATPACDPLLITGVVFGKLGARPDAIAYYRELEQAPAFIRPRLWRSARPWPRPTISGAAPVGSRVAPARTTRMRSASTAITTSRRAGPATRF